jgi:hypothetical protein
MERSLLSALERFQERPEKLDSILGQLKSELDFQSKFDSATMKAESMKGSYCKGSCEVSAVGYNNRFRFVWLKNEKENDPLL